jgi:hypothetical protein
MYENYVRVKLWLGYPQWDSQDNQKESCIHSQCIRVEVLTTVVMKSSNFWDIMPCSPLKVNRYFGGTFLLHPQRWRIRALLATCFHAGFLFDLFFYPDVGGDMFLRNFGWLSMDCPALDPRRLKSSCAMYFTPTELWIEMVKNRAVILFNLHTDQNV